MDEVKIIVNKNDNYLNFPALSFFFEKLKTLFATKNELNSVTGIKGDKGEPGDSAGFGTPTATVDANVGTPSVTVTASGPNTSKIFNFDFKNLKGATGAKGSTGTRGSMIYSGTTITGTSTTATVFSSSGISSALVNDLYINTLNWNVYQCTTAGAESVAKWIYKGNIKGATPELDFKIKSDGHLYLIL